jgi:SAM-dependent methyltransferase
MRRPLPECLQRTQIEALYASHDYLDAYRRHTDMRVRHDHQAAVGGLWEEIGRLQLDYLVANSLQPHHSLLDIGCGTLRAGRHLIRYLDAGRYTGFDLSPAAINAARRLVLTEGIAEKRPRLFVNRSGELTFPYSQCYDFLLAHSVFTHLPEANIEVAIAHIGRVMHPSSLFFFTFADAEKFRRTTTLFPYPFEFFRTLAGRYGFDIGLRFDYPHPRGQSMVVARRAISRSGTNGPR